MLSYYRKIWLFLLLIFICFSAEAQELGGNPSSIKWMQVNTPQVRVIFPNQQDSVAKRVAAIISHLNRTTQTSIGTKQKKINLVLQNETTISNGYVGLGPFRSEFFLTPLQNSFELGSLPWADQLAIHEFRHVQQYNNFNVGLSKLFKILFGQEGQALANNLAIPDWFYEGDAVYSETNVTSQGRGRLPFFHKDYRSLWQANKNYSWLKLRNGSLKHFVPDHYALGYLLVAYGREKYGDEFWKKVTQDAAAFKGLVYPFQRAIKKYSGKDYVTFRNEAVTYFKNNFISANEKTISNKTNTTFLNQEFPSFIDGNKIVYVKSSFKKIHSFIIKDGNIEKKIRVKDVSLDNHFSFNNGKIIYASYQPDKRWGNRDFSIIQILDITSGKQLAISKKSKYFAPDINADASKIVAVEVTPKGAASLKIMDVSGKILTSIPNPDKLFYTYPKFYNDKIISAVRNTAGEMAMGLIDPSKGSIDLLTPFTHNAIAFPSINNDTVYFSASYKEEEKLFAISLNNKKLFLLSSALMKNGLGSYQATANNNKMAWTTFTADGFRLQEADKSLIQWLEISSKEFLNKPADFGISSIGRSNINYLDSIVPAAVPVTKYRKSIGLLNFHSIQPLVDDPEYTLTLISENILNTLQSQLSFTYNRAEQWKKLGFSGIYGGLFPFISAGVDYTIDRRGRFRGRTIYWNELEPYAGFNIPLNLSKGRSLTYMNFGSRFVYNQSNFQQPYKDTIGTISYSYLNNFFSISNQIQKARQNIFPRFAQSLSLSYKTAISKYDASQFVANGNLFLPGILTNHNLVINGAYLKKDTSGQLNFSSGFPFSRGYQGQNLQEMIKWGANYHLPLIYPDKGFASIVYFLRLRANLFYDHTYVNDYLANGRPFSANFRSTGAEIYFDTKWWNTAAITVGVRYSYLLDKDLFGATGKNRWELILPVNIFDQ